LDFLATFYYTTIEAEKKRLDSYPKLIRVSYTIPLLFRKNDECYASLTARAKHSIHHIASSVAALWQPHRIH